jgi:hypothetical protein
MQVREEVPLVLNQVRPSTVVVVIKAWSRLTDKAMHFAMRLSPDVIEVHLTELACPEHDCRKTHWNGAGPGSCKRPRRRAESAACSRPARPGAWRPSDEATRAVGVLIPELVKRK